MQNDFWEKTQTVGTMQKRRVLMADKKRYLIYYTFGSSEKNSSAAEIKTPESQEQNSTVEEGQTNV